MAQIIKEKNYDGSYTIDFIHKGQHFKIFTRTKREYIYRQIKEDIERDICNGKFDQKFPRGWIWGAVSIKKKDGSSRRVKHLIDVICMVK